MICDGDEASCSALKDYLTVDVDATNDTVISYDLKYYQDTKGWKKTSVDVFIDPYDPTWLVRNRPILVSLKTDSETE